jgi:hypothetical protein
VHDLSCSLCVCICAFGLRENGRQRESEGGGGCFYRWPFLRREEGRMGGGGKRMRLKDEQEGTVGCIIPMSYPSQGGAARLGLNVLLYHTRCGWME